MTVGSFKLQHALVLGAIFSPDIFPNPITLYGQYSVHKH